MAVIDGRKLTREIVWSLPGCANPTGLAIDIDDHRLFSACENKIMVVTDSVTGQQVARIPIGEGPDAVAFDPHRKGIFVSNGEGTLSIIRELSPIRYAIEATVPTQPGARTGPRSSERQCLLGDRRVGAPAQARPKHPHPRRMPIPGTFTLLVVRAGGSTGAR